MTDEELTQELIVLIGWKHMQNSPSGGYTYRMPDIATYPYPRFWTGCFEPFRLRDHSRYGVDRCAELGLGEDYVCNLRTVVEKDKDEYFHYPWQWAWMVARATPAQESRAVHKTLKERAK